MIRALGGIEVVLQLTGANAKQAWNWTGRFGAFPANTYVCLMRALNRRGYTAPARLWNMKGISTDEAA
ncbi:MULTISPECIES: hypothetical protein [unclassified Bradyrhizobium]|uniref:hypothetical protein n=1 Tax=unclassified Bradyrhizobium TaxID=2631580 RepID=UPI002FF1BA6D